MTEETVMDAPELWGIDPDQLYPWTPRAGRVVTNEGDWDAKAMEWKTLPTYGKAKDSAPVLMFKPISEKVWTRLSVAINKFNRAKYRAAQAVAGDETKIDAESKALSDASEECFPADLISETVGNALAGWENIKGAKGKLIEFSGKWERDEIVIRKWKDEAFKALIDETVFAGAADSFT
jgi:hypothetical protein